MIVRLVIAALLVAGPAVAQDHAHDAGPEKLGTVRFDTSCSPAVQPPFNRAVALLHSFDFGRAEAGFRAVLAGDPSCAIAGWGIALSRWGNPFAAGLKPAAQLEPGQQALAAAAARPAATERERAFIAAASRLYDGGPGVLHAERVKAYRDAMAAVAARYPADDEASIFYALSLAFSADPADKTYASQRQGGVILEKLFAQHPDHPGLAHYIIHTYDVPPLASQALGAARRYATIAPSAPHALHMPSHTFTRVGAWQESIETNIASAASARREGTPAEELHASDYQVYGYLQLAQDAAAGKLMATLPELATRFTPAAAGGAAPPTAGFFALAAVPARYALERGAWAEAVTLTPQPSPFPFSEAITHFARAVGAGQLRDPALARASVQALLQIRDRLTQAREDYWADQVEIQRRAAVAYVALAEGRTADAVAEMRIAADCEDTTEKNAITPGPLAPARELLGYLLLDAGTPAAALAEFDRTLAKEPNRFRALAGAAKAAAGAGDRARARTYYTQLLDMCARGEASDRPELIEAKTFVAAAGTIRQEPRDQRR